MSVNSYGIGGSNVHVSFRCLDYLTSTVTNTREQIVIDSAASFGIKTPSAKIPSTEKSRKSLLLFSAGHEESLKRVSDNIKEYLNIYPDRREDTAYTLASRREHMKLRNFSVFGDASELFQVSAKVKYSGVSKVAYIFTGQGAQW